MRECFTFGLAGNSCAITDQNMSRKQQGLLGPDKGKSRVRMSKDKAMPKKGLIATGIADTGTPRRPGNKDRRMPKKGLW